MAGWGRIWRRGDNGVRFREWSELLLGRWKEEEGTRGGGDIGRGVVRGNQGNFPYKEMVSRNVCHRYVQDMQKKVCLKIFPKCARNMFEIYSQYITQIY